MPKKLLDAIPWTEVDSSNVKAVFHCDRTDTVAVRFNNGGLYTYMGVKEEIYMGLVHAQSVGSYLSNVLKAFPYTRWETEDELLNYFNIK